MIYLGVALAIVLFAVIMVAPKRFKYRLDYVYLNVNWYKWLFWLCEWCYFPLLFNIAWVGNC
jgi:hypothetical protein